MNINAKAGLYRPLNLADFCQGFVICALTNDFIEANCRASPLDLADALMPSRKRKELP